MSLRALFVAGLVGLSATAPARAENPLNDAQGDRGVLPANDEGQPLNFDFETGTLQDWTPRGKAWEQQPIKGEIAEQKERAFGEGKQSLHTGDWWLGGYERLQDTPTGTLTSVPFKVTHPWCSFLVAGGAHAETRVELVRADGDHVFFRISGVNQEELQPVVVNLQSFTGQKIYIRIVDDHTGGWGHVNFDDFRFHARRPKFEQPLLEPKSLVAVGEVYPHAGLTAEEAARVMQVPPGFSVQVASSEPDIQQPIAMAVDDRGRLWVAEAHTYPQRAEPGEGKDRILIFEDTDLDGTLDNRKVFVEGLNLVSGLEVGFGGVWVGAAPYLMFIPDRNGNDVPDGLEQEPGARSQESGKTPGDQPSTINHQPNPDIPPGARVLLDGWHYEDTHETLNAFIWGPDGWLYGCHGVFTRSRVGKPGTADEDRIPINAGIWRYHPTRHEFEVFAHGTSNPWGVDFDDWGECFCTACVIPHLYHVIQAGRYQRQAGQHFNPHTYDDIKTIARHRHFVGNQWNDNDRKRSDDLGGGHAHAGAMFYLGGAWPDEYRNQLFMNNIHGNRLNVDQLARQGSGYSGDRAPDFLLTGDKWSQMLYMTYGPDGQVWVIDWYDANQCHRPEEGAHDRTNGRIYRIAYNGAKPVAVDLQTLRTGELVDLLTNRNDWYARHARRILQEREGGRGLREGLRRRFTGPDVATVEARLRTLWALHAVDAINEEFSLGLLNHAEEQVRAWAIRLELEDFEASPEFIEKLGELARMDPSPAVRLAIASALQRMRPALRWEVLEGLTTHSEDANDHNLPLMYWYAMEPLADENPQRALALAMAAGTNVPLLRDFMIRRLGSGDPQESLKLLVGGLVAAGDDATRVTFLRGMHAALTGHSDVAPPDAWPEVYAGLLKSAGSQVRVTAQGLAHRFKDPAAGEALRALVLQKEPKSIWRGQALSYLLSAPDAELVPLLYELLSERGMRDDAIKALARFDNEETPERVLSLYGQLTAVERQSALATLASRPGYAARLLVAVRDNQVPRDHLSADLIRQLRNLGDAPLNEQIEKVWGVVRDTPEDRLKLIAHYRALAEASQETPPDKELGRAVFAQTCQKCHLLFGTGSRIGPDITGANRTDLNYLLSNIIDPSAVMAKEYRPTVLATTDGRVITGIVKEETPAALTIQTTNELLTIPAGEIDERRESEKSMMPDDQLKTFSDHDVRSLIAYLSGPGQTAILATRDNVAGFFNGKDLTGWFSTTEMASGGREAAGSRGSAAGGDSSPQPLWTVENGEIVGKTTGLGHNEFLVNELSLGDFRFSCEVKLLNNAGNSGIQIRSQPLSDGEVRGYQCDIGAGWWGKLYEERGRGLLENNDAEKHVKPGEWNHYQIVAVGSRVQTFINGELCVDRDDPQGARRGIVALQLHSGGPTEVRFRNFELELVHANPVHMTSTESTAGFRASVPEKAPGRITWKKTQLDNVFRSEGVTAADFDNDGRLDIAAGSIWFRQASAGGQEAATANGRSSANSDPSSLISHPSSHWQAHSILEAPAEFNINGYSESFMNWAEDFNGDGRLDLIVVDFPGKQTWWFENPGASGSASNVPQPSTLNPQPAWPRHELTPVTNNESPQYLDLTGDGRRELVFGFEGGHIGFASPQTHPAARWKLTPVSLPGSPGTDRFSHGLGIGDLNGDGRKDVLVTEGWWEASADPTQLPWTFHAAPFGKPCSHMYVYDFDADGDADVLSASAHDFGIWWHEQIRLAATEGSANESDWVTHEIDTSFSETHAVCFADLNGDGLPDFVTGKRWWSHNGHGPGADGPAVLYWYEFSREGGKPAWTRHTIDEDSGVGTQFEVADINGDGRLDVATSNKKGTFLFEQVRE